MISEDLSGEYESPITMIVSQLETKMENDVLQAIQRYGIQVNKDELIKALNYDRQQYDKGYRDGYDAGYKSALNDVLSRIKDLADEE